MTATDFPIALPPRHALHEFRIERVLGHGGFGITYLADDTTLRKKVAIKEYLPAQFAVRAAGATVMPRTRRVAEDYRWGLERFLDEARTLARFRHPNIVPVLRFFEAHGTAYIVMEYEAGQPLADLLAGPGRLPPARVRTLIEGIIDGLAQVHATGFLHRDIKPSNVIVRADGTPVLVDFGAARQALRRGEATLTSVVTPRYAPLEQYQADAGQGPWTDIYSLAAVAFHAITGAAPPEATARVRTDACRKLASSGIEGHSPAFLAAIDHGLAVHPEERPQTIAAWRQSMGPAPASVALDKVAVPTPAAAPTRVMQEALTGLAAARAADAPAASDVTPQAPRLGGVDVSQRARPAVAARRGWSGRALAGAAVALALGTAGVYAWQVRTPAPPSPRTVDTRSPSDASPAGSSRPGVPGQTAPAPTPTSPRTTADPRPPTAPPPDVSTPPSIGRGVEPKGDPVPIRPPSVEPADGTVASIDDLLNRTGTATSASPSPAVKAARDKMLDSTRQMAAQAQAAAESAQRARQRAMERAGEARIRAAEATKSDLSGAERVTFDGGGAYVGQLADGRRGGLGVAELASGERQAGEWKDDRLEGLGVLRAGDGRSFEGEWRDGLPDGVGVFRLGPQERHFGEVKGGQPQGPGVRVAGDGAEAVTRAGIWRNGLLEGPGVETTASGWRYEGSFRAGRRHGPGTLIAPDGLRFHGTFVDGVADGYGVAVAADGGVSSGEWRAGSMARRDD